MTSDNIFSGLKVVDLASFIAGPSAAVILSDFGAEVIKVEPPTGDLWRMVYKVPPQPHARDNYLWHLNNRNKRGIAVDLKSPHAVKILERLVRWADVMIVNTPHPARKRLKLEYEDATAVGIYSAIVTALYRRERTGKGSYVTTSLLAEGVWACGVSIQAALCNATFYPLHDRKNPPSMLMNVYRASDDSWFLVVLEQSRWPALAKGIGRPDLLTDPRFNDAAKQAANSAQLTAILDEVFGAQPMAHWH